jgi:lactate 2-monooxygenase
MGDAPRWFQLYWSRSDDLVRSFVQRAERCGCDAIVLTLDTTLLGWRTRDLDLAWLPFLRGMGIAQYTSDPVFLAQLAEPLDAPPAERVPVNLASLRVLAQMLSRFPGRLPDALRSGRARAAVQRFVATYSRPSLTWENLSFLRDLSKLPILLKGIQHPDDAREAVRRGMDGIIVSNHGGRQVDGAIGALDALPGVVEAVDGRVPVLFDSGIRGGADLFKALALGATAACVGRPYAYGLAIAGEAGVREVIQNVAAELDLTMGLAGCTSVREIGRDAVVRAPSA